MTICPLGTVNFVALGFHKRQNNVSFELDLQGINWLTAEKTEPLRAAEIILYLLCIHCALCS